MYLERQKNKTVCPQKDTDRVTTVPDFWVLVLSPGTISFLSCMRLMRWPVAPSATPQPLTKHIYIHTHIHIYIYIYYVDVCVYIHI